MKELNLVTMKLLTKRIWVPVFSPAFNFSAFNAVANTLDGKNPDIVVTTAVETYNLLDIGIAITQGHGWQGKLNSHA